MPSAAPGSGKSRGKPATKAQSAGPKRPPRHDTSTNGRASGSGGQKRSKQASGSGRKDAAAGPPSEIPTESVPAVDQTVLDVAAEGVDAPVASDPTSETAGRRRSGGRSEEGGQPDGRRRGRRVKRVLRRIDLWSVLKLSIVLYTCLYAAVLATLALLWGLAYSTGQIDKVESFMADVGMDNYRFYGDQMFRACAMIGAVGVLAGTVITVLTAALVNVISETTGGIRLIVIEEDPAPRRRRPPQT